jgi:integrase/recombinase XerC
MATLIKQQITRYVGPDGKRCKSTDAGARRVEEESAKWYGVGIPGLGDKRVPLSKDKRVSLRMLSNLIDRAERGEHDLPQKGEGQQPLEPLVKEFEQTVGRKAGTKHTKFVMKNVRRVLDGCGLVTLADLRAADTLSKAESLVWGLTKGDEAMSPVNAANVGKHAKQFTRWLWRKRKVLDHDPLAGVDLPSQATVGKRRALSPAELATLIDTARASGREFRDLTGPQRAALYLTAAATGFRAGELAIITPSHVRADADVPSIRLSAEETKNGKEADQPIPAAVVARLRPLLADRPAGTPLWPGTWWERAADMFRDDMAEAGLAVVVDGEEAVFHSLRHSYGTMLGRVATLKTQQELSRHSTPTLTIGRYSHTDMAEKAAAVERLPLPESGNTSAFAALTRPQLERYAEAVTAVLAGLAGVLVTPMVTPPVDSAGDDVRRAETKRPGKKPRQKRVKG